MPSLMNAAPGLAPWKVQRRDLVLEIPPWFAVFREELLLPDGRIVNDYYQIDQPDFVSIVAVNAMREALGLWRYKHGPRCVNLGVPAGYLKLGEDPLTGAKRELMEECALNARKWTLLGSLAVDGNRSQMRAHIFLAEELEPTEEVYSDDLETAVPVWLTLSAWREHLSSGDIKTMGAATALMWAISSLESRVDQGLSVT